MRYTESQDSSEEEYQRHLAKRLEEIQEEDARKGAKEPFGRIPGWVLDQAPNLTAGDERVLLEISRWCPKYGICFRSYASICSRRRCFTPTKLSEAVRKARVKGLLWVGRHSFYSGSRHVIVPAWEADRAVLHLSRGDLSHGPFPKAKQAYWARECRAFFSEDGPGILENSLLSWETICSQEYFNKPL